MSIQVREAFAELAGALGRFRVETLRGSCYKRRVRSCLGDEMVVSFAMLRRWEQLGWVRRVSEDDEGILYEIQLGAE